MFCNKLQLQLLTYRGDNCRREEKRVHEVPVIRLVPMTFIGIEARLFVPLQPSGVDVDEYVGILLEIDLIHARIVAQERGLGDHEVVVEIDGVGPLDGAKDEGPEDEVEPEEDEDTD